MLFEKGVRYFRVEEGMGRTAPIDPNLLAVEFD